MKYFRVHSEDIAYLTQQPRGIFTAIYELVESKKLNELEEKVYMGKNSCKVYQFKVLDYDETNNLLTIRYTNGNKEEKMLSSLVNNKSLFVL